jgi:hypothetical protein
MPAYATVADFEAYVPGWVTDDADELDKLLERASRDIDSLLGPVRYRLDGVYAGFKLDPAADLDDAGAAALARATCAQAEHRYRFVEPGLSAAAATGGRVAKSTKGPDFEQTFEDDARPFVNATGLYSPRLRIELAPLSYLRSAGARARP